MLLNDCLKTINNCAANLKSNLTQNGIKLLRSLHNLKISLQDNLKISDRYNRLCKLI